MKFKISICFLAIILSVAMPVNAQNAVDIEKTLITSYSMSDDIQLHHKVLEIIRTRFDEGREIDDDIMNIIKAMAKSSITKEVYEDGIHIKTNLEVQLKSISLLGELGGQEALDSMTALLKLSNVYPILLETINSSAAIKAESYDEFIDALVAVMKKQHYLTLDNGFAFAALYTLDRLTEDTGIMLTPEVIKILLTYSESAYIKSVHDYIRKLLLKY